MQKIFNETIGKEALYVLHLTGRRLFTACPSKGIKMTECHF